tara:strand:+ start:319 stop:600 length:282 start_codon:yes stop_codon:yes gene_type:complete
VFTVIYIKYIIHIIYIKKKMMDEDYIMYETCDDCKHRKADIIMIYNRGDGEALCKKCYIKMLRDVISRYQERSIVDLVKWVNRLTTNIEFINI